MVIKYETPIFEVIVWESKSIVTSSNEYEMPIAPGNDGTELPIAPANGAF